MNFWIFLLRISVCFILSILIGLERQYRHRMVGLRTNVLVSLGAFMFMIVSYGVVTNDESRIAAQIVSGIGFLGAGVILREGSKIKGLNTAATLWCVASIGVLTAAGMIKEAIVGTIFVLISNIVLRLLSLKIMANAHNNLLELCTIDITCKKDSEIDIRRNLYKYLSVNDFTLECLEKYGITKESVKLKADVLTIRPKDVEEVVTSLGKDINVSSIKWKHIKYKDLIEEQDDDEND